MCGCFCFVFANVRMCVCLCVLHHVYRFMNRVAMQPVLRKDADFIDFLQNPNDVSELATHMYTLKLLCVCLCVCVYVYVCVRLCVYVYVYVRVCLSVHVCFVTLGLTVSHTLNQLCDLSVLTSAPQVQRHLSHEWGWLQKTHGHCWICSQVHSHQED